MFSNVLSEHRHSLAFRLTLWYAVIFAFSSAAAFAIVYYLMVTVVQTRTDEDLIDDLQEFGQLLEAGGLDRIAMEMNLETEGEEGAARAFFRLWTAGGEELMTTDLAAWAGLEAPTGIPDEPRFQTLLLPDREYAVRTVYGAIAPDRVLQIGESLEADEEFIETFLNGFLLIVGSVIVLGGPIGWFMARRALGGVRDVTQTAMEIADGDLDRRVTVSAQGDELDTLAVAFNKMLDRIQALIIGMREMTDNLAHDFRSPLARIRASAELSLTGGVRGDFEAMAANTAEECDRLLEMINTTLDIAEAESGAARLTMTEVDLAELVHNAVDLFQPVAEDKRVRVVTDLPKKCIVRGDLQRLQRVVANLIDNALKYMPEGGRVDINLVEGPDEVQLSVKDTGVGMSPEECARIFERFYRCDRSRSQAGNGLGLSLALAFLRAQGGDIGVSSAVGEGSCFTAVMPRAKTEKRGRRREKAGSGGNWRGGPLPGGT